MAYTATTRVLTEYTSFGVVYGNKAVIPPEVGIASHCVQHFEQIANKKRFEENLNLVEEAREEAKIWTSRQKRKA